jgi:hypothetical protein
MNTTETKNHSLHVVLHAIMLLVTALCLTGCQAAHESGGVSHAVVQIDGQPLDAVQQTTAAVFGEEGYSLVHRSAKSMVFERAGSRRDASKYGGWSGEGVTMRVYVTFTALANAGHRLQADVTVKENETNPIFEDENRAMMLNRRPYQKLLNEVESRLTKK